jgi:hypothetical protein
MALSIMIMTLNLTQLQRWRVSEGLREVSYSGSYMEPKQK